MVMVASSATLFIAGVACLFAPVESLAAVGFAGVPEVTGQVLGALYLGFAAANWTARGSMIGGIYARPLSVANFVHFVVGAIVVVKGMSFDTSGVAYLALAAIYVIFAILFTLLVYGILRPVAGPD